MNNLVELSCPADREDLSLRRKELKDIYREIKEIAMNPFLRPSQKRRRIKDLKEDAEMVGIELEEKETNILSNYI